MLPYPGVCVLLNFRLCLSGCLSRSKKNRCCIGSMMQLGFGSRHEVLGLSGPRERFRVMRFSFCWLGFEMMGQCSGFEQADLKSRQKSSTTETDRRKEVPGSMTT